MDRLVLRPNLSHEILIDILKLLHKNRQERLDHATVKGLIRERNADIKIDAPVFAEIILENLILGIERIEIALDTLNVLRIDACRNLRPDNCEEAVVDENRHRHDLPLRLDARTENRGMKLVGKGLRLEEVDVVLLEEFLELLRLCAALMDFSAFDMPSEPVAASPPSLAPPIRSLRASSSDTFPAAFFTSLPSVSSVFAMYISSLILCKRLSFRCQYSTILP